MYSAPDVIFHKNRLSKYYYNYSSSFFVQHIYSSFFFILHSIGTSHLIFLLWQHRTHSNTYSIERTQTCNCSLIYLSLRAVCCTYICFLFLSIRYPLGILPLDRKTGIFILWCLRKLCIYFSNSLTTSTFPKIHFWLAAQQWLPDSIIPFVYQLQNNTAASVKSINTISLLLYPQFYI